MTHHQEIDGPRIEDNPKWIRGYVDGRLVVDSLRSKLVWEVPWYPAWYFPDSDLLDDSLPRRTHSELPGFSHTEWAEVDRWFEEDIEVFVHPRSPYTRIDALRSSRHVTVRIDGVVVADTRRPTILFETGLPARWYIPAVDVRLDILTPTDTATGCPYKGTARYWSATVEGAEHDDVAWSYPTPLPESAAVAGLVCFYDEMVELTINPELGS